MLRGLLVFFAILVVGCGKGLKKETEPSEFNVGDFPNVENTVYGQWRQERGNTDADGVTHTLNIYLNDSGKVGFMKVCSRVLESLTVPKTLPGSVTTKQINVDASFQKLEKGTGTVDNCELNVNKGPIPYEYRGDVLYVQDAGKQVVSFVRMR